MDSGSFRQMLTAPGIALAAVVTYAAYVVLLTLYRLFLHPLASFPGPKLAAVTSWYEAYYEIILQGQYSKKIGELHDVYGPIVRVTPNEIHIRDSGFFEEFYAKNQQLDKHGWDSRFGTEGGVLTTVDAALHKRRRAALSPMFSRRSIISLLHIIQRHIDTLSSRMDEFASRKEPMNLTHAFPALTGDIIMDYFFGFNYGQLKDPEFNSFHEAFMKIAGTGHLATQFPWILPLMNAMPDSITEYLQPAAAPILKFRRDQWNLIGQTLRNEIKDQTDDVPKTIFQELLSSRLLPPSDKTHQRLADEAQIVVGGGVETTAFTLSTAFYHIVSSPTSPTHSTPPFARNPRTRNEEFRYKEWMVPRGTNVSMTIPDVSHDEEVFPESKEFRPERWLPLGEVRTADGVPLERFLVCFGRGTRSCLGMNLAWTELYLTLGMMFRKYKFELYESDVGDVEIGHDFFIPVTRLDSKGVRAFVTATAD
ncbi:cytochrome P450 [Clohesyomyces aquaticus]|uniref:Cytochrome P450 n=1 Tax=Clohesyomyces aquaticus TaxID=1231657 RepID=A0A1Y2A4C5_9PLEO|nr:cytochrome P450 [Clohesyomyces aquaticus]